MKKERQMPKDEDGRTFKWRKITEGLWEKVYIKVKKKRKYIKPTIKKMTKKEIKKHTNNRSKGYRINYDDYCLGCSRTEDEVYKWESENASDEWKEKLLEELKTR